jgi:hypothetical protein
MCAMLTFLVSLLIRPTYSAMDLGGCPAASMRVAVSISLGMTVILQHGIGGGEGVRLSLRLIGRLSRAASLTVPTPIYSPRGRGALECHQARLLGSAAGLPCSCATRSESGSRRSDRPRAGPGTARPQSAQPLKGRATQGNGACAPGRAGILQMSGTLAYVRKP